MEVIEENCYYCSSGSSYQLTLLHSGFEKCCTRYLGRYKRQN